MRYIIYGAGAIGGAIGGRLHEAGHEVILICRGAQLDAIRAQGLRLETPEADRRLQVPVAGHPREIEFRGDDAVILTMKGQDTERALLDLETSGGADLPIICAQNGVENERIAARRFARVYAMLVAMPATYLTPGEVNAPGAPYTGVLHAGRYPSGVDSVIEEACAGISRSGFRSDPDPKVMRLKHTKLLANVGNAIQVITGAEWFAPETVALRQAAAREAIACYAAAGIEFMPEAQYNTEIQSLIRGVPGPAARGVISSSLQSVLRGNSSVEADSLNGEIVLLGRLHGIATPINAILRRLAVSMVASGEQPGRYTTEDVLAMVGSG